VTPLAAKTGRLIANGIASLALTWVMAGLFWPSSAVVVPLRHCRSDITTVYVEGVLPTVSDPHQLGWQHRHFTSPEGCQNRDGIPVALTV